MTNTGIEYECFVQTLMQAIIDSENQGGQKNICVRQNEIIEDNFGIKRQFDVLWDYEQGGITYKTVIECKDYNSPVSIEKIDALIGKLKDFPTVRGIIATTQGYQSGAKEKAKNNGIELLCIRKSNASDWIDEDGTPLVKGIVLNLTVMTPPEIIYCKTFLDKEYVEKNNIDINTISFSNSLNTEVFIDDMSKNEKYSLYELQSRIAGPADEYGVHEKDFVFDDAYIFNKNVRLKLKKLTVKYRLNPPITTEHEINAEDYVLGVVEYLNQNRKKTVFNTPDSGITVRDEHISPQKATKR